MAIKINEKTRIAKTANGWDIQFLIGEDGKERWISKYYYTNLLSALKSAFNLNISGRKNVDIDKVEKFVEDELKKFLDNIEVN